MSHHSSKTNGDSYATWLVDIGSLLSDQSLPTIATLQATNSPYTGIHLYNAGFISTQGYTGFLRYNGYNTGYFVKNTKGETNFYDNRTPVFTTPAGLTDCETTTTIEEDRTVRPPVTYTTVIKTCYTEEGSNDGYTT